MTATASPGVKARASLPPLIVDLDNTLVRTDTLIESVLALATSKPLTFIRAIAALRRGRAGFKHYVAGHVTLDPAALPYNEDILAFLRERRAAGGRIYLVTAADRSIAEGVAAHLGLFDGVVATENGHNLKGAHKAAALAERFGEGFDYIGDSPADIPVWSEAREILLAEGSGAASRALARNNLVPDKRFPALRMGLRDWVKALRLHQWSKNTLLFLTVFLGQEYGDLDTVLHVFFGFLAFGVVASATYLINDLNDLAADRAHFGKRHRALASGRLPLATGIPLALLMLGGGMGAAFLLNPAFGLVVLGYLALTLSYSFILKAQPLLDVLAIGSLFTLRIYGGMALTGEASSLWLTSFAMVLFSSLALAKRHAELIRAAADGREVVGRGYRTTDAPLTVALGIATASISTVVMLLYLHFDVEHRQLYTSTEPLFFIPLVLSSWLMRIWVKAHRGELHDDPVVFALKDKISVAHAAMVGLCWLLAVT